MTVYPIIAFLLICAALITALFFRLKNSEEKRTQTLSRLEELTRDLAALRKKDKESQNVISGLTAQILSFHEITSILGQAYEFEASASFAFRKMLELLKVDFGVLSLGESDRSPLRILTGISEEEYEVLQNVPQRRVVLEEKPGPFRTSSFEDYQRMRDLQVMSGLHSLVGFACRMKSNMVGHFVVGFRHAHALASTEMDAMKFCADQLAASYEISKRLSHTLEIAQLRKDYISTVSHELRTPLSTVYGYLNILKSYPDEMLQSQEKAEMFAVMTEECHRLIRLIDNLLLSAQVEQEDFGQKLSMGPVALDQIVSQALRHMDRGLKRKEIEVVKDIPPDLPQIYGNSDLLYQVFQNLIANSIKFCRNDPRIEIVGREESRTVLITLTDNGVGIEEKDLSKIFEKFFRSDGQTNRQPGLGIGLYLVQKLVHLHGGEIAVSSRLNQGTTFNLRFPKALH